MDNNNIFRTSSAPIGGGGRSTPLARTASVSGTPMWSSGTTISDEDKQAIRSVFKEHIATINTDGSGAYTVGNYVTAFEALKTNSGLQNNIRNFILQSNFEIGRILKNTDRNTGKACLKSLLHSVKAVLELVNDVADNQNDSSKKSVDTLIHLINKCLERVDNSNSRIVERFKSKSEYFLGKNSANAGAGAINRLTIAVFADLNNTIMKRLGLKPTITFAYKPGDPEASNLSKTTTTLRIPSLSSEMSSEGNRLSRNLAKLVDSEPPSRSGSGGGSGESGVAAILKDVAQKLAPLPGLRIRALGLDGNDSGSTGQGFDHNFEESTEAVKPLGELYSQDDSAIAELLQKLQTTSEGPIDNSSDKGCLPMRRWGRTNVPKSLENTQFKKECFNQSYMKDGALCPAQVDMIQYIDPAFYDLLSTHAALFMDRFDGDKWAQNATDPQNTLAYLGDYFGKDFLNTVFNNKGQEIGAKLQEWDSKGKFKKNDGEITIDLTPTEQNSPAGQFLKKIFANSVVLIKDPIPETLEQLKKNLNLKIQALHEEDGHGVQLSWIDKKIEEIDFEMGVIKIRKGGGENPKDYRYKILESRKESLQGIRSTIESWHERLFKLATTGTELDKAVGEEGNQFSKIEDEDSKKRWLVDNENAIIAYAEKEYEKDFESISQAMAEEFLDGQGFAFLTKNNDDASSGESKKGGDASSGGTTDYTSLAKKIIQERMASGSGAADGEKTQDLTQLFEKRFETWYLDIASAGINKADEIPERVYYLWGRHAGVPKETIMNLWKKFSGNTDNSRGLTDGAEDQSKTSGSFFTELENYFKSDASKASDEGSAPLVNKLEELKDWLVPNSKGDGEPAAPAASADSEPQRQPLHSNYIHFDANTVQGNVAKARTDILERLKGLTQTANDGDASTNAGDSAKNIKNIYAKIKVALTQRLKDARKRITDRLEKAKKQYTFNPKKTESEMFAPFVRPGHDGKPEVLPSIFDDVKVSGDSESGAGKSNTINKLNQTIKVVVEGLMAGNIKSVKAGLGIPSDSVPGDPHASTIKQKIQSIFDEAYQNDASGSTSTASGHDDVNIKRKKIELQQSKRDYIFQLVDQICLNAVDAPKQVTIDALQSIGLAKKADGITTIRHNRKSDADKLDLEGNDLAGIINQLSKLINSEDGDPKKTESIMIQLSRAWPFVSQPGTPSITANQAATLINSRLKIQGQFPLKHDDMIHFRQLFTVCGGNILEEINNKKCAIQALFYDVSLMESLQGDKGPLNGKDEQIDAFFNLLATHYTSAPKVLKKHLAGKRFGSTSSEDPTTDLPPNWYQQFIKIFELNNEWSPKQQQDLIALTMHWPPHLKEVVSGFRGLFEGKKGHVVDTVVTDPDVVRHRYVERLRALNNGTSIDGITTIPVDAAWVAVLGCDLDPTKASEKASTSGAGVADREGVGAEGIKEGFMTEDRFKIHIIEKSIQSVLDSVVISGSGPAGLGDDVGAQSVPNITVNGRLDELAVLCESLPLLRKKDVSVSSIYNKVLNDKLYFASSSDDAVQRIKAAVVCDLLVNGDPLNDENVLKCMIMMHSLAENLGYSKRIADAVASKGGREWTTAVGAALMSLKNTEDNALKDLAKELHGTVFKDYGSQSNGGAGEKKPAINLLEDNGGLTSATFNHATNMIDCVFKSAELSLNAVTMTTLDNSLVSENLSDKEKEMLRNIYFKNKHIPGAIGATVKSEPGYKRIGGEAGVFMIGPTSDGAPSPIYYQQTPEKEEVPLPPERTGADTDSAGGVVKSSWVMYCPYEDINGSVPFKEYIQSIDAHFWKSVDNTVYVYTTEMQCLYTITNDGQIKRMSDEAMLKSLTKTDSKYEFVWEEGGQLFMEIIQGDGILTLSSVPGSGNSFQTDSGRIYQNSQGKEMVFKHPERPEYEVITFHGSGIPVKRTTRHPANGGLMMTRLKNVKPSEGGGAEPAAVDAKDVCDSAVGADALSQVIDAIDLLGQLKEGAGTSSEGADGANRMELFEARWLSVVAEPVAPSVVKQAAWGEFIKVVNAMTSNRALAQHILRSRLPYIKIEYPDGRRVPADISSLVLDNLTEQPTNANATLLTAQLVAGLQMGNSVLVNNSLRELQSVCDVKSKEGSSSKSDNLTPITGRVLRQAIVGVADTSANSLKKSLNINPDPHARTTYWTTVARDNQPKDESNPALWVVTKEGEAFHSERSTLEAAVSGKGGAAPQPKSLDEHLLEMESRLSIVLGQSDQDHLTVNDIMYMAIQGDPYGVLKGDWDRMATIQRLALGIMILRTEKTYLVDKADRDYTSRAYKDDLERVLTGNFTSESHANELFRKCAVYLACEEQLGHRLRDDQFKAVSGILDGKTKLAELRTGFGKTDVVLFLTLLYKGKGKGVRLSSPDALLEMNRRDIGRKLTGMACSVWEPSLDFNAIKAGGNDSIDLLKSFLYTLKTHNKRGDIMIASHYTFDQQLDDCLNVCIAERHSNCVKQLFDIKKELADMALNLDEVHTFDPYHTFNIMDGKEQFKKFERVELCRNVIQAVHKSFVESISDVQAIATDQSKVYEAWLKENSSEIRRIFTECLPGTTLPDVDDPKDWKLSSNDDAGKKIAYVHHLIYTLGPQIYKMQHNREYGFREGTLEAVPYVANNQPSLNENFTDAEQIQWLTFNARHIQGDSGVPVTQAMLARLYLVNDQLNGEGKEGGHGVTESIKELLTFVSDYGNRVTGQGGDDNVAGVRLNAFKALQDSDPKTNADRARLDSLINNLTDDDKKNMSFYLFGNTSVKERLYESNPSQSLMTYLLKGNVFGCSGTMDRSVMSVAWGEEHHTSPIQHAGDTYTEFDAFYDKIFNKDAAVIRLGAPESSQSITEKTINKFKEKAYEHDGAQLLVDAGALIQGETNREVAEALAVDSFGEVNESKWVVYYDTDYNGLKAIYKKESDYEELTYVELVKRVELADSDGRKIKKDNIIVFFDDARKTGTDVKKITCDKPKMIVTVAGHTTTTDIQQAIGRDRTQTYDFKLMVRPNEFEGKDQTVGVYNAIKDHTEAMRNQNRLMMAIMDAKAALVEDVRQVMGKMGGSSIAGLLKNNHFKTNYQKLVSKTMDDGFDSFGQSTQPLSTKKALSEHLEREKKELLNIAGAINRAIQTVVNNSSLTITSGTIKSESSSSDAGPSSVSTEKKRQLTPKQVFEDAFYNASKTIDGEKLRNNPLIVAAPSGTAAQSGEAQSEALGQQQSQQQNQQQSQQQVLQMEMAQALQMACSRTPGEVPGKPATIERIIELKPKNPVTSSPTFGGSTYEGIFNKNPTLAETLRQFNVQKHIQFSDRWLEDLEDGAVPRVHAMVESKDVIYVLTPEELQYVRKCPLKEADPLKNAKPVYDGMMHLTVDKINSLEGLPKAQKVVMQLLVDGLTKSDRDKLINSGLNKARDRIMKAISGVVCISSSSSGDGNAGAGDFETKKQAVADVLRRYLGTDNYGFEYVVAHALSRQLAMQGGEMFDAAGATGGTTVGAGMLAYKIVGTNGQWVDAITTSGSPESGATSSAPPAPMVILGVPDSIDNIPKYIDGIADELANKMMGDLKGLKDYTGAGELNNDISQNIGRFKSALDAGRNKFNEKYNGLVKQYRGAEGRASEAERRLQELQNAASAASAAVMAGSPDGSLVSLENLVEQAHKKVEFANNNLTRCTAELERLKGEAHNASKESRRLQGLADAAVQKLAGLKRQAAEDNERIEKLRGEARRLRGEAGAAAENLVVLKRQADEENERITDLQAEARRLQGSTLTYDEISKKMLDSEEELSRLKGGLGLFFMKGGERNDEIRKKIDKFINFFKENGPMQFDGDYRPSELTLNRVRDTMSQNYFDITDSTHFITLEKGRVNDKIRLNEASGKIKGLNVTRAYFLYENRSKYFTIKEADKTIIRDINYDKYILTLLGKKERENIKNKSGIDIDSIDKINSFNENEINRIFNFIGPKAEGARDRHAFLSVIEQVLEYMKIEDEIKIKSKELNILREGEKITLPELRVHVINAQAAAEAAQAQAAAAAKAEAEAATAEAELATAEAKATTAQAAAEAKVATAKAKAAQAEAEAKATAAQAAAKAQAEAAAQAEAQAAKAQAAAQAAAKAQAEAQAAKAQAAAQAAAKAQAEAAKVQLDKAEKEIKKFVTQQNANKLFKDEINKLNPGPKKYLTTLIDKPVVLPGILSKEDFKVDSDLQVKGLGKVSFLNVDARPDLLFSTMDESKIPENNSIKLLKKVCHFIDFDIPTLGQKYSESKNTWSKNLTVITSDQMKIKKLQDDLRIALQKAVKEHVFLGGAIHQSDTKLTEEQQEFIEKQEEEWEEALNQAINEALSVLNSTGTGPSTPEISSKWEAKSFQKKIESLIKSDIITSTIFKESDDSKTRVAVESTGHLRDTLDPAKLDTPSPANAGATADSNTQGIPNALPLPKK